tara:strand:- start:52 stop:474 length:423 start_codon:yes stop_codon:yes gene_type:complete
MIQVTVPIYYKKSKKETVMLGLNFYRNIHYSVNDKAKKFITGVVEDNIEGDPILGVPIHVHYKVYLKRRGSDGGNVRSVIEKYVLDAVKKFEYIKDDNFEIVVTSSDEYHHDKTFPRCEVLLLNKITEKKELKEILLNLL